MHNDYADIRDRIPTPPLWWDENAVPRYVNFTPSETANIYAEEAALALITCQNCGHAFMVAFSWGVLEKVDAMAIFLERGMSREEAAKEAFKVSLAGQIRDRTLHYGDPPNIYCCASGPTMNSEPRRVIEYWSRDVNGASGKRRFDWERDPSLEIEIEPDWVKEGA